jgi:putative phosphotransacetylase
MISIPVEISARHVHISEADFKALFGSSVQLSSAVDLSQTGEFASNHFVTLKNKEREIEKVRILGPFRGQTQVEVSFTDARYLRATVPLRLSGNLAGSAPVQLLGPNGAEIELSEGMIVARRHLHISPTEAGQYNLSDGQEVSLRVAGDRGGQLDHCLVRIKENYNASFHIDTDEANALGLQKEQTGELIVPK